jgi:glycosyltransferase involved in cell wall biosynthesis
MTQHANQILIIASWYPNKHDVQWGIFHRLLFQNLPQETSCQLIHIYKSDVDSEEIIRDAKGNLKEILIGFKPYKGSLSFLNIWLRKQKLESALKRHTLKPDLVHLMAAFPMGWPLLLSRLSKKPLIYSESWSGWLPGRNLSRTFLQKLLLKNLCSISKKVLPVSDVLLRGMRTLSGCGTFEILPNIIQPPSVIYSEQTGAPYLLYVGDFHDDVKNVTGLLKAYAKIPQAEIPLLKIVGDGPDRRLILKTVDQLNLSTRVKLLGRLSNREVYAAMAHAAFGVINSRYETFGMVVLEFTAHNKPVVCTRCGGPEAFFNEGMGLMISADDECALQKALVLMAGTYKNYQPCRAAFETLKNCSPESVGSRLAHIYEEVLR